MNKILIDDIEKFMIQLGISIRFNVISGKPEISGMPSIFSNEHSGITLPIFLMDQAKQKINRKVTRADIDDALIVIMDKNRYNPVKDMILSVQHDGLDRINVIEKILGVENNPFSCKYIEKWLHQTVAMAFNDELNPYGADGVLVLQGSQGAGKTLFFSKLATMENLFAEGVSIDLNNKDSIIQATGTWIAELGELDSTLKREQSQLKAFLTDRVDTYRLPYAKSAIRRPRRTSFCATVNPLEFLNDETGSRRFWVVPVEVIDTDALLNLKSDWLQQLWRQVYDNHFLKDPQGFRLSRDERSELQIRNSAFEKPIPAETELLDKLNFDSTNWCYYTSSEVVQNLNLPYSASQVGKALTKLSNRIIKIDVTNTHNVKRYLLPVH